MTQPAQPSRLRLRSFLLWLLTAGVLFAAIWGGLRLRRGTYDVLRPLHFKDDLNRNWVWGYYTYQNIHTKGRSFLDTYDDVGIQKRDSTTWLDYTPGRLAVMTAWAAWNIRIPSDKTSAHPDPSGFAFPYGVLKDDKDPQEVARFYRFVDVLNTAMELLASAGAFVLTLRVVRVAEATRGLYPGAGLLAASCAAILLWFNPAVIVAGHGWLNTDTWTIAPFLWATYFGHRRNWFTAGVIIGLGMLLKSQLVFGFAVLVLWPIFQFRWRDALGIIGGAAGTFGLLTIGWTLTWVDDAHKRHLSYGAVSCFTAVWIVAIVLLIARRYRPHRFYNWAGPRFALTFAFAMAGGIALCSMSLFHTNYAWFDAAYGFHANRWEALPVGLTSNLPGLLQQHYGWQNPLTIVFSIGSGPGKVDVTLRAFLLTIFLTLLVVSTAGIAWQHKRTSRRFLIAIVTPWLLYFAIPTQVHERYLIFAAAVAAVCCGYSFGMTMLGIFMSIVAGMMTLLVLLGVGSKLTLDGELHQRFPTVFDDPNRFAFSVQRFINGTHPDIGWALLLVAGIFLYYTLTPDRQVRPAALSPVDSGLDFSPTFESPGDFGPGANFLKNHRAALTADDTVDEAVPAMPPEAATISESVQPRSKNGD